MTFLNFSQLPESVFRPNFSGKHFPENQAKFPLTGKCFLLTNFSNGKQIQESLESGFSETTFRKTNTAKRKNIFLETKPKFSLTRKCFPLTGKYFRWPTFLANKYRKVWKVIFQKVNFGKQTWPWRRAGKINLLDTQICASKSISWDDYTFKRLISPFQ